MRSPDVVDAAVWNPRHRANPVRTNSENASEKTALQIRKRGDDRAQVDRDEEELVRNQVFVSSMLLGYVRNAVRSDRGQTSRELPDQGVSCLWAV